MTKRKDRILSAVKIFYSIFRAAVILIALIIVIMFMMGIRPYAVQTGSMGPEIKTDSICFVDHHAEYDQISVGDIIAFRTSDGAMVTHRVSAIDENGMRTKGDANNAEDIGVVTKDNFIGKTIFWLPFFGKFINLFHTMWGKFSFFSGIAFLLAIGSILEKQGKPKESPNQEEKEDRHGTETETDESETVLQDE